MKDCAVQSISLILMTERTQQVYFPSPPPFLAPNFLGLWFSLVYGSFNGNGLVASLHTSLLWQLGYHGNHSDTSITILSYFVVFSMKVLLDNGH